MKRLAALVSCIVILMLAAWACGAEPTQPVAPATSVATLALVDPTPTLAPTHIPTTTAVLAVASTGITTVPQLIIKAVPGNLPSYTERSGTTGSTLTATARTPGPKS